MKADQTDHTAHIHCVVCGECLYIPLEVLLDSELEARAKGRELDDFICDTCI